MAKDKKTHRSTKTLPNQWSPMNDKFKNRERRKNAAEIRAMKQQNLSRGRWIAGIAKLSLFGAGIMRKKAIQESFSSFPV